MVVNRFCRDICAPNTQMLYSIWHESINHSYSWPSYQKAYWHYIRKTKHLTSFSNIYLIPYVSNSMIPSGKQISNKIILWLIYSQYTVFSIILSCSVEMWAVIMMEFWVTGRTPYKIYCKKHPLQCSNSQKHRSG